MTTSMEDPMAQKILKALDEHGEALKKMGGCLTMTTSVEDPMAQKILKVLDEHGEILKKMGGHLTRFEESRLKKSSHMEINDN